MRPLAAALLWALISLAPAPAGAQEETPGAALLPDEANQTGARRYRCRKSAWGENPSSWFLSGRVDLGTLFLKPRVSLGYGRAHWAWIGIDANPIISSEGIGGWWGVRFALPRVDLRIGGRYRYTFRRSFLVPRESYNREQIELRDQPRSKYLSWEAELTGAYPAGPGAIFTELAATMITLVPDDFYVYEETLRVVARPPWVLRGLVGYALFFLPNDALSIAALGQVVTIPERQTAVIRAGVSVRFRLAYNLELRGTFMPAVDTPDDLGLAGGDSFQLGIRYLWALPLR